MNSMQNDDFLQNWSDFVEAIRKRLEKGREEYGDRSFSRPADEIAGEIEEELLDVAGWAFFLWLRVVRLKKAVLRKNIPNDI